MSRAVFVDDSGESDHVNILSALCLDEIVADDARDRVSALRDDLERVIPAFKDVDEFHGVRLARRLTKREAKKSSTFLKDHERAFIFQHTLSHIGVLPGRPRIYTLAVRAEQRPREQKRGTQVVDLTRRFFDWLAEGESIDGITTARFDEGSQFVHNQTGFTQAAAKANGAIRCNLTPVKSHDDLLIQMADMVAHSAFQAFKGEPKLVAAVGSERNEGDDEPGKLRFPDVHTWYRQGVGDLFAPRSGPFGIRSEK